MFFGPKIKIDELKGDGGYYCRYTSLAFVDRCIDQIKDHMTDENKADPCGKKLSCQVRRTLHTDDEPDALHKREFFSAAEEIQFGWYKANADEEVKIWDENRKLIKYYVVTDTNAQSMFGFLGNKDVANILGAANLLPEKTEEHVVVSCQPQANWYWDEMPLHFWVTFVAVVTNERTIVHVSLCQELDD